MLTLPTLPTYQPTELDIRIAKELDRAHRERAAAKAKGYWPVVQGCDRVIETLRRLGSDSPYTKGRGNGGR